MKFLYLAPAYLPDNQFRSLANIYGQVHVDHVTAIVETIKEALNLIRQSEAQIVIVDDSLPLSVLADLVRPSINPLPVITSVVRQVPTGEKVLNPYTGAEEPQYELRLNWDRIIEVRVVTTPFL